MRVHRLRSSKIWRKSKKPSLKKLPNSTMMVKLIVTPKQLKLARNSIKSPKLKWKSLERRT